MNLFTDPRCTCPSTPDIIRATLQDSEPDLCPVHQTAEIKAREVEAQRDEHRMREARLQQILDELRAPPTAAPPTTCTCDAVVDIRAALEGREVSGCDIHRPTTTPSGDLALGSDELVAHLERQVGAGPISHDDFDPGPQAA